jgi:adenylyltransferase/sulfurtransferase
MGLSELQQVRYSRMTIMEEVGEEGQERIVEGRVAVVGMGGLGSPLAMYLASAGVGRLELIDDDVVEESNLSRQVLYTEEDLERLKVEAAYDRLVRMNGECEVVVRGEKLSSGNVEEVVSRSDVVVDGSDSMESKFLLSDEACRQGKPFVFGAVQGVMGEVGIFCPEGVNLGGMEGEGSCLRCLYPQGLRVPDHLSRCDVVGVWGAIVGIVGSLQALAVLQLFVYPHRLRMGCMTFFDGMTYGSESMEVPKVLGCEGCGRV